MLKVSNENQGALKTRERNVVFSLRDGKTTAILKRYCYSPS